MGGRKADRHKEMEEGRMEGREGGREGKEGASKGERTGSKEGIKFFLSCNCFVSMCYSFTCLSFLFVCKGGGERERFPDDCHIQVWCRSKQEPGIPPSLPCE